MLQIQLLGPFSARCDGRALPPPQRQRTLEVWARLLLAGPEGLGREHLAYQLWPSLPESEARTELRRQLYFLKRYLQDGAGPSSWLARDRQRVAWAPEADVGIDARSFDLGYERYRLARPDAPPEGSAEELARLASLVRGELLEGSYAEWLEPLRDRYRSRGRHILRLLVAAREAEGDLHGAQRAARRLLRGDPLHEEHHRLLIGVYLRAGDRSAALEQFHVARRTLREKLDVEPAPETLALGRSLMVETESARYRVDPGRARSAGRPMPREELIGRRFDLRELEALLPSSPLLTLTGPSGIGKTRLAVALLRRLSDDAALGLRSRWIDVAALREPDALEAGLGEALRALARGAHEDGRGPAVLVLDGIDGHRAHLGRLLAAALALPGAPLVLSTGRAALGLSGERRWPVPPLAVDPGAAPDAERDPPAIRLFLARAQEARPGFRPGPAERAEIVRICRGLEGLPLAIELAARRLDRRSLAALRRSLSGSNRDLIGGPRDAPPRQRAMDACHADATAGLEERERALLRRAAVFAAPFRPCDLYALGPSVHRAREERALDGLLDASFLLPATEGVPPAPEGEGRLRLAPTLRPFVLREARRAGERRTLRRAHAAWLLARAREERERMQGPSWPAALRALRALAPEWRQALPALLDAGEPDRALALAAVLWRSWYQQGGGEQEAEWLDHALEAAPDAEPGLRASAWTGAGVLANARRDRARALACYGRARALREVLGERDAVGEIRGFEAVVHLASGDLDAADAAARASLEARCAPEDGRKDAEADAWALLAEVALRRGDSEAAERRYRRALPALRRQPWRARALGNALWGLGMIAQRRGRLADAGAYFEEGLEASRAAGDQEACALWLNEIACLHLDAGDLAQARATYRQALTLHRDLDDAQGRAMLIHNLGELAALEGDAALARYHFGASLETAGAEADDPDRLETLLHLAEAQTALGELLRARDLVVEVGDRLRPNHPAELRARHRCAAALLALAEGEDGEAAGQVAAGLRLSAEGAAEASRLRLLELALRLMTRAADFGAARALEADTAAWRADAPARPPWEADALARALEHARRHGPEPAGAAPDPLSAANRALAWCLARARS